MHDAQLKHAAKTIDNSRAAKGFRVVKHNGQPRASLAERAQDSKKSPRKTTRGPREGGVLNKNPDAAPSLRLQAQGFERSGPTVFVPRDAANFELKIVRAKRFAEVTAIVFDRVGGFVA